MTLAAGTRLGSYEVVSLLGEGGMGQVYRARDTRLGRDAAIKVLPAPFAHDPDRLARFEREARTLASLNHPNIAIVHGLEQVDGSVPPSHALVMELVEGPTLADRVAAGPLPVDEAIPIAEQIAQALEAAHEQGIVHRDLKPANIKVRPDGTVKVLDFGLAKAVDPPGGAPSPLTMSPTLTSPAMTAAGVLLGTAPYMSPEQARGRPVDKRTDIWAFGAVLYEMLTGRPAFPGEDVSDVLASVLAREPDWTRLPAAVPPSIVNAIKRCLERDRKQRVRDIGDVLLALKGGFETKTAATAAVAVAPPLWQRAFPVVTAAVVAALITGLAAWARWPRTVPRPVTRFEYLLSEEHQLSVLPRATVAASPDGRSFAYVTGGGIYIRNLADLDAKLLPGTASVVSAPFFSPDSQWLAYFASGQLMKVPVSGGGGSVTICATGGIPSGASWDSGDSILFGNSGGIMRVPAGGGAPERIIEAGPGEEFFGPQLLPDGQSVLFSVTTDRSSARWDQAQVVVQSPSSKERTIVVQRGNSARYVPSGHLVYALRDGLFAIDFDPQRKTTSGGARLLVQGAEQTAGAVVGALPNFSVSDEGTLLYVPAKSSMRTLVWRSTAETAPEPVASIPPAAYEDPRLSPDGGSVLLTRDGDIWIHELASGRSSRFTRNGANFFGVWDQSGSRIAYSSSGAGGSTEAWVAPVLGSEPPRQLTRLGGQVHVDAWSPDGKSIGVHRHAPEGGQSVFMIPSDPGDSTPRPFLENTAGAEAVSFSPDGKYVAYISTETKQREVYVRPYPGPGGQLTVSIGGGREPMWTRSGEVFYRNNAGDRMFAVAVTTVPALKIGQPVERFAGSYYIHSAGSPRPQYDVTHDGKKFLMLAPTEASSPRQRLIVVQNWPAQAEDR